MSHETQANVCGVMITQCFATLAGLPSISCKKLVCFTMLLRQGSVVEDSMLTWACRYVEALRPKSFSEHDLMDPQARFYFREKAIASKSGDVFLLSFVWAWRV